MMNRPNGLDENTSITFTVVPTAGITISNLGWSITKGTNPNAIYTSTSNPLVRTFNHTNEGPGDYLATAIFQKSDGNSCELAKSFQIISGDICVNPSGISGPALGFVGEETSPFSVDHEDCYVGSVVWDMNSDNTPEYNSNITDSVTYTYNAPGTYTVRARTTNSEDNSQTTLTHQIVINYANCTNGATNPPLCDICTPGSSLVNGQCVPNCTNGTTNPPQCSQCPIGNVLVNGQCIPNCTNGASNPPTCNQCPSGQVLTNGQCVSTCTNGANNPPLCNQCSAGSVIVNGQCIPNCTNGANNPPSCNQCPSGQALVNGQCTNQTYTWNTGSWSACSAVACNTNGTQTRTVTCMSNTGTAVQDSYCTTPKPSTSQACSARACNACTLDGVTVSHNQSRTFYSSTVVACGQTCSGQSRTCVDGAFNGSSTFNRANCTAQSCSYNWEIGNWSACSAVACNTNGTQTRSVICRSSDGSVAADASCTQPKPITSQSCSARACNACTLPWGGTIAHGQAVTAYQASQVSCGQSCSSQPRTCTDGLLSGSFTQSSCSEAPCPVNGSFGSANNTTVSSAPTYNLCNH